jgi:hypothetical protein
MQIQSGQVVPLSFKNDTFIQLPIEPVLTIQIEILLPLGKQRATSLMVHSESVHCKVFKLNLKNKRP